ncbi:MAG: hypothetical protein QXT13_09755 [Pyrobaculum sp.]
MFSYLTEWGEQIIRFVLLFNLIYALVATAWYGATGLGSPYMPDWLNTQIGEVEVTNNPMQIPNAVQMMFMFTTMFATGLVQIVQLFQNILPQWLYAPLFAIALFLQTIALMYVAYRVFQFIKSMLSPLAPVPSLIPLLLLLALTNAANGLWFDQIIVGYITSRIEDGVDKFYIRSASDEGYIYLDAGDIKIIPFNIYLDEWYFLDIEYYFFVDDKRLYTCSAARDAGYYKTWLTKYMCRYGIIHAGDVLDVWLDGISQFREVLSYGVAQAMHEIYQSRRAVYMSEFKCVSPAIVEGTIGVERYGRIRYMLDRQNPVAIDVIPGKFRIEFLDPYLTQMFDSSGRRGALIIDPNRRLRSFDVYYIFVPHPYWQSVLSTMPVLIYQDASFNVYEYIAYDLRDMIPVNYDGFVDLWGIQYYFFTFNGERTEYLEVLRFAEYIRETDIGIQPVGPIEPIGHPKAKLRVTVDRYRLDAGWWIPRQRVREFNMLLAIGGEPIGIGVADRLLLDSTASNPYEWTDTYHARYVQQTSYIMYNPGDWLIGAIVDGDEYECPDNRFAWGWSGPRRLLIIELPHECPHILSRPTTRSAVVPGLGVLAHETSNTKLHPYLQHNITIWVPLNSSSYYVVAIPLHVEWGDARRVTYAGYGGVLVNNDDTQYIIYEYNNCRLVSVFVATGRSLAQRPGVLNFEQWATQKKKDWIVSFFNSSLCSYIYPYEAAKAAIEYLKKNNPYYAEILGGGSGYGTGGSDSDIDSQISHIFLAMYNSQIAVASIAAAILLIGAFRQYTRKNH